ncbi:ATP-binding protein [Streptomyces sp. NPDC048362]|uniref:ATP-binding protein n=1 Tax=unclassified Streptomyces TaxID=2593676 RepID=UPI0033EBE320
MQTLGEGTAAPSEQPMRMTVALDGSGGCIARARHAAADFLARTGTVRQVPISRRALDVTQLVVSELVTNAGKYAPGPATMDLRIDGDMVEIVVWDSDPTLPAARAADAGRIGQHGLEIVKAVAHSFEARSAPAGKRVTARIALQDAPDAGPAGQRSG